MDRQTLKSAVFFFNDTATTEIYTLSLHDALPISGLDRPDHLPLPVRHHDRPRIRRPQRDVPRRLVPPNVMRSEEHTSELQSRQYLVCRLLLEKKTPISRISSSAFHYSNYINIIPC